MASLKSLQKRYERCIQTADYYGAEQSCRMMHHRLTQGKNQTTEDIEKALSILISSSVELLSKQQAQEGSALGLAVVKHYIHYKKQVNDLSLADIRKIAEAHDTSVRNSMEVRREKLRFLKTALSWSSREDCAGFKYAHPTLNAMTARAAAETEKYEMSQQLYTFSNAPEESAKFLYKYAADHADVDEYGLILTRIILRYLASDNIKDAGIVRSTFSKLAGWSSIESGGDGKGTPPLGNFCELLIKICQLETAAAPLFTRICKSYQGELSRDESFEPILTKLGTKLFGIQPPPPTGMAGIMNTMLRGMMGNS